MSGLDHPAVREWLARLDTEASVLPEDRRTELRSLVEEQLATVGREGVGDHAAYERVLAELGSPEALVAEAGGYAVPPVDAIEPPREEDAGSPQPDAGAPRLEVAVVALLLTSVVLALLPATEAVAPAAWFVGTILVLLSRRWGPGDKGLAVLAFGVLGVPLVLLGRGELPTGASVVVGVALVVMWLAVSLHLLRRAWAPRDEGRGLRMR
jgi:hypothetical protein